MERAIKKEWVRVSLGDGLKVQKRGGLDRQLVKTCPYYKELLEPGIKDWERL